MGDASPTDAVFDGKADGANGLTAAQKKTFLQVLDQDCGDSWCEGDYTIDFANVTCMFSSPASSSCTLVMKFTLYQDGAPTNAPSGYRSCKVKGLHSYSDLMKDGDLTDNYLNKLNDCVDQIEAKLPF